MIDLVDITIVRTWPKRARTEQGTQSFRTTPRHGKQDMILVCHGNHSSATLVLRDTVSTRSTLSNPPPCGSEDMMIHVHIQSEFATVLPPVHAPLHVVLGRRHMLHRQIRECPLLLYRANFFDGLSTTSHGRSPTFSRHIIRGPSQDKVLMKAAGHGS